MSKVCRGPKSLSLPITITITITIEPVGAGSEKIGTEDIKRCIGKHGPHICRGGGQIDKV